MVFFLGGCPLFRTGIVELSESDIKNADAFRVAMDNCRTVWPLWSGVFKEIKNKLPYETIEVIQRLDKLAATEDWTDEDRSQFFVARTKLLTPTVKVALEEAVPGLWSLLISLVGGW